MFLNHPLPGSLQTAPEVFFTAFCCLFVCFCGGVIVSAGVYRSPGWPRTYYVDLRWELSLSLQLLYKSHLCVFDSGKNLRYLWELLVHLWSADHLPNLIPTSSLVQGCSGANMSLFRGSMSMGLTSTVSSSRHSITLGRPFNNLTFG